MQNNDDQVFTSWKEIAAHFQKGVRTVQRWEQQLGLPVRRRNATDKHMIVALRSELDEWLRSKMQVVRPQQANGINSEGLQELVSGLEAEMQQLKGEIKHLRSTKESIQNRSEILRALNDTGLAFLKTEIATAMTFVEIALHCAVDDDKRRRNARIARKAYDTVVRFGKQLALSEAAAVGLEKDLMELKAVLLELGESF